MDEKSKGRATRRQPPELTPTGRVPRATLTKRIALVAGTQGGVVGAHQLKAFGLSRKAVRTRVTAGSLIDLGGDVFAVGHATLGEQGWRNAALLAAGFGSALSHWTAAALWGLTDRLPDNVVEVSAANRSQTRACRSVTIHRPRSLAGADIASQRGYRCTTIFRTLLDLTPEVEDPELRRMIEMALTKHAVSPLALASFARRNRHQDGSARLGAAAAEVVGPVVMRSRLESAFRSFCEERGIPAYEANVPFGSWEIDGLWRLHGVALELDFYVWHGTRSNYRRDRKKGMAIERAGAHLLRVAGEDLEEDPDAVHETVLEVLRRNPPGQNPWRH